MKRFVILAALLAGAGVALAQPQGPGMGQGSSQAFKVKRDIETLVLDEAGGTKRTQHTEFEVLNATGVTQSQIPVPYRAEMTDMTITGAYTLKPDGRKIPVAESAILTRSVSAPPGAQLYSDQMQKTVVFPNVEVGDTLVLDQEHRQKQALFEGHTVYSRFFSTTMQLDEAVTTISVPSSRPLSVEAIGVETETRREGDRTLYIFRRRNPKAVADVNLGLSPWDRMPRIFASTFRSYDEFARFNVARFAPKMAVTAKLQAEADRLTDGATDRREQARRIYNYVSTKVRYVAVNLGTGGVIPHDAEAVLANGYGDCKDKAVLLAALLKAKGIASEVVVINGANAYSLSGPPTMAQLNHAILWLPEFGIYADATAGVAPFGLLPLPLHGKPAIHLTESGPVRRQVPVVAAGAMSVSITTDARMDDQGKVTGTSKVTASGPLDVMLRQISLGLQASGGKNVPYAAAIHPVFHFDPPDRLDSEFAVRGEFSVDANPRFFTGDSFVAPTGTWLVSRPGFSMLGPLEANNLTEQDDTPCHSGVQEETINLTLPDKRRLAALPKDVTIKNDLAAYEIRWSQTGQTVSVRRTFTAKIDQPLCSGAIRRTVMVLHAQIRQANAADRIALARE